MAARLKSLPRTVAACRTSLAQHADCKHKAAKQQQALQPTFHPVLLRTTTAARGAELVAKGCTRWRPATSACLARQSPHLPAQAEARLTLNSAPTPSRPAMCATAPRKWPCAVPSAMRVRAVSMGYTATLAVTPGGGGAQLVWARGTGAVLAAHGRNLAGSVLLCAGQPDGAGRQTGQAVAPARWQACGTRQRSLPTSRHPNTQRACSVPARLPSPFRLPARPPASVATSLSGTRSSVSFLRFHRLRGHRAVCAAASVAVRLQAQSSSTGGA